MDLGLEGKVALAAASSKGLGRAVAAQLAAEGASVMLSSRDEAVLEKTAAEIKAATNATVEYCAADLTREEDIRRLVEETAVRFGGVDVLVTNSGGPPAGGFEDLGEEDWSHAFELNLMSLIRLIRFSLPHMRERGEGRIVVIASSSIKQPIENLTLSNTFRAGIAGLAKSLSSELASDGVLINTIGPGRISTDRSASLDGARADALGVPVEEIRADFASRIPLGRYGTPEEFAKVAAFLASSANSYVTGQALLVDGGMVRAL